jgi:hypothetical protein
MTAKRACVNSTGKPSSSDPNVIGVTDRASAGDYSFAATVEPGSSEMSTIGLIRTIGGMSTVDDVRERAVSAAAALSSAALLLALVWALFGSAEMAGHITTLAGPPQP